MADFEEVMSIVNELEVILNACTEEESINSIVEYRTKLKELREKQDNEIKVTISEIINEKQIDDHKCEAESEQELIQVEKQTEQLEITKTDLVGQCNAVSTDVKRLSEECAGAKSTSDELENLRSAVKKKTEVDLSRERHLMKLYRVVTDIKWQFESEQDEIKGTVFNTKGIKPFTLDKKENSSFYISNYLWQLIDVDWD